MKILDIIIFISLLLLSLCLLNIARENCIGFTLLVCLLAVREAFKKK